MMNPHSLPQSDAAPFTLSQIVASVGPLLDLAKATDRPVAGSVLRALLHEMAAGKTASL